MRFRSFQSLHPNCTPFGRATSHIGKTLYAKTFLIIIRGWSEEMKGEQANEGR